MGNETSTPSSGKIDERQLRPDASSKRYRSFSSDGSDGAPLWLANDRTTSVDSLDSFGDDDNIGETSRPKRPPRSSPTSRRRVKSFDGGSLKGNIAASQDESKKGFVDPILSAAAVGAKARKSKHSYLLKQRQLQRQREEQQRIKERIRVENEWKSSLRMLASAAASTAATVAHATAPVLNEATTLVRTSAKEFAQELNTEWNKEDEAGFEYDEESVQLYSPMTTPLKNYDLSISVTTTPNESINLVRTLDVPILPTSRHTGSLPRGVPSQLFPHHSSSSLDDDHSEEAGTAPLEINKGEDMSEAIGKEDASAVPGGPALKLTQSEKMAEEDLVRSVPKDDEEVELETRRANNASKEISQSPIELERATTNEAVGTEELTSDDESKTGGNYEKEMDAQKVENESKEIPDAPVDVEQAPSSQAVATGDVASTDESKADSSPESDVDAQKAENESKETSQSPIELDESTPTGEVVGTEDDKINYEGMTDSNFESDVDAQKAENECKETSQSPIELEATPTSETVGKEDVKINYEGITDGNPESDVDAQKTGNESKETSQSPIKLETATTSTAVGKEDVNKSDGETKADGNPDRHVDTQKSENDSKDTVQSSIEIETQEFSPSHSQDKKSSDVQPILKESKDKLPLFDATDELVYEAITNESLVSESKQSTASSSRRHDPVLPESLDLLHRPKNLLSSMISKASGYEFTLKRIREPGGGSNFRRTSEEIPRSVFDDQVAKMSSSRSVSSSVSPPEIPFFPSENDSTDSSSEDNMGEAVLWDLYPPKQDVVPGEYYFSGGNDLREKRQDTSFNISEPNSGSNSLNELAPSVGSPKNVVFEPASSDPLPRSPRRQARRSKQRYSQKMSLDTLNASENFISGPEDDGERDQLNKGVSGLEQKLETLTVKWENDDSGSFPGVPDAEDISETYEGGDVLDEALLAFSSLDDVKFLKTIEALPIIKHGTPSTSLPWRHLLASWKHAEIWKAMIASPCTLQVQSSSHEVPGASDVDSFSSTSTSQFQYHESKIDYGIRNSEKNDMLLAVMDISGFSPQTLHGDVKVLTGYICDIGPTSFEREMTGDEQAAYHLHQQLPPNPSKEKEGSDEISDFLRFAEESQTTLDDVVRSVVQFSSRNSLLIPEDDAMPTPYSIGVKSYSSAKKKAARKYAGDITRVLDLLRAQIVFPDEGSLICGLVKIWSFTRSTLDKESGKGCPVIEIVRLKNLFRTSPAGTTHLPALPTGYRHILVNIRLSTGIIAELQFQLSQFYEVLGSKGYELHQALFSGNEDDTKSQTTLPPGFDILKFTKRILGERPSYVSPETAKKNQAPEVGSVASASAAAAKTKKTNPNPPVPGVGGIAAMAAAAAAKKNQSPEAGSNAVTGGGGGGGIAAMAAAAAAKRIQVVATGSNAPPGAGGIAAMADAAAAAKKNQSAEVGSNDVPGGGGIAAIAAATAAANKNQATEAGSNAAPGGGGGGGGIAAMAAAAAAKKNREMPGGGGGIASLAAAAAAKKKQSAEVDSTTAPRGGGGIAAMAAAAAAKRSQVVTTGSSAPPGAGGIAAMAAAAAARKNNAAKSSSTPSPGVAGIAALAAAAAAVKKIDAAAGWNEKTSTPSGELVAEENKELELVLATMKVGALEAQASPRDFSSFYCLYLLARRLNDSNCLGTAKATSNIKVKEIHTMAKRLLLRSLAISNQATSMGMVGWLEYGQSDPLERTLSLPFEVLRQLSCNLAADGDWDSASDVLGSLVLRCEQLLPPYHPTTLSAMLDLSAALSMAGNDILAHGLITRVSDLLSLYLSQHERLFYQKQQALAQFEYDGDKMVSFDDGEDVIALLKAFATSFWEQLSRDFLQIVPSNHQVKLFNHSFVADSLAVLANCLSACEERTTEPKTRGSKGDNTSSTRHKYYWSLAYEHYQQALRGWLRVCSLTQPNAAATAYSVARSLRELGMLEQALKILTALASALKENLKSSLATSREFSHQVTFLMPPPLANKSSGRGGHLPAPSLYESCRNEQTLVLGLWLMAVLTVEQSPDERGRIRALSLLHSASDALRRILAHVKDLDEVTKTICLELYECIEQEARVLFEPMQLIPMPRPPKIQSEAEEKDAFGDLLSPMRLKRWYNERKNNQDPSPSHQRRESPLDADRETHRKPIIHLI